MAKNKGSKKKSNRGQHTGKGKHEPWKNSPIANPFKEIEKLPDGERRTLVSHTLGEIFKWYKMEPVQSDDELEDRLIYFFETCIATGELPTVEKMALACGVTRQTIWEWERGGPGSTPRRSDSIKKAKEFIASYDAQMVANGKMQPVAYIFRAKNFYGMKDQVDHRITPQTPLEQIDDVEEISKRIEGAVVIEDLEEDK